MDRNTFKELCEKFYNESEKNRVDLLLQYDLKTLSNSQIERLLEPLSEEETKVLIKTISKKLK